MDVFRTDITYNSVPSISHHSRYARISDRYIAAMMQAERPLGTMVLYSV